MTATTVLAKAVLRGFELVTLDPKGRVCVPVKFREDLLDASAGIITLTRSPRGCVLLFPQPQWIEFCNRRDALEASRELPWEYASQLSFEEELVFDNTGRVNIPLKLRNVAKLSKDVLLIGRTSHIEIWDDQTYEATANAYRSDEKKDPNWEILNKLGI